jgi:hypothetical protein
MNDASYRLCERKNVCRMREQVRQAAAVSQIPNDQVDNEYTVLHTSTYLCQLPTFMIPAQKGYVGRIPNISRNIHWQELAIYGDTSGKMLAQIS